MTAQPPLPERIADIIKLNYAEINSNIKAGTGDFPRTIHQINALLQEARIEELEWWIQEVAVTDGDAILLVDLAKDLRNRIKQLKEDNHG